jgi:hypothetical protein
MRPLREAHRGVAAEVLQEQAAEKVVFDMRDVIKRTVSLYTPTVKSAA